ncbi:MAG: hypothetical protein JNL40_11045 [Cyclobacteriaceae bacterium]|nr:hypothetical protein [Cyclobacteriaceae bacterium]
MQPNSSAAQPTKTDGRKSRVSSVFLGIMAIVTILSFVYAFVQQVKASKNAEEALKQYDRASLAQQLAEKNAAEAVRQQAMANEARRMLEECRQSKSK